MHSTPRQLALPLSVPDRSLGGMNASVAPELGDRQKGLGAFYTPPAMAGALAGWAIRSPRDRVLDPSFGGLVFLKTAAERLKSLGAPQAEVGDSLFGVDIDPSVFQTARTDSDLELPEGNLLHRDFLMVDVSDVGAVDAVVGNPPYIRYQGFNGCSARVRELTDAAGVKLTRLASSWAPFVVHGASFVAPGGRMALVLPAELLHAQYANEVVDFLRRSFGRIHIAVFEERIFPGALEEVVLLLADERGSEGLAEVQLIPCTSMSDLDTTNLTPGGLARKPSSTYAGATTLIAQLLSEPTRRLLDAAAEGSDVRELGQLASVDIGVVTGSNEFFVLTEDEAARLPSELLRPVVAKAKQVAGARLTQRDHQAMLKHGQRGLLFVGDGGTNPTTLSAAQDYLARGVRDEIDQRYKCRIRDPWWALPLPKHGVPDLFLTYCSGEHPRLVVNEAGALNTNTVHGVKLKNKTPSAALATGFINSLTLLTAELVGRSYGGGVLKVEPTEAEGLLIPPLPGRLVDLLPCLDELVRARDLAGALDLIDPIVLGEGLGLAEDEIAAFRADGERLRNRRRSRGSAPRA